MIQSPRSAFRFTVLTFRRRNRLERIGWFCSPVLALHDLYLEEFGVTWAENNLTTCDFPAEEEELRSSNSELQRQTAVLITDESFSELSQ